MSDAKINALKDLIVAPKNLNKLIIYERKVKEAALVLLFDARTIVLNADKASSNITLGGRLASQIRNRIDSLIDQARYDELRFRPGTDDKTRKIIANNCLIYDFIIFSRVWDLKEELQEFDSAVVFGEMDKAKNLARKIIENIQTIDELISSKDNVKTNIQATEDVTKNLYNRFNNELEIAESAGALKGVIRLEKPKLIGRSKYYEQLGNLILKVAFSFGIEHSDEPISLRAVTARLNDEFPRVHAEPKDVLKATEKLNENGFLILSKDYQGLYWVSLKPSESAANIVLSLAEKNGTLTIEELVKSTNWPLEKATEELDKFVQAGCAIRDSSYSSGIKYYFPGLTEDDT